MRGVDVLEAEQEALRFLARVQALRETGGLDNNPSYLYGSAASGAVKRASMDLTRSLAKMRKGDR